MTAPAPPLLLLASASPRRRQILEAVGLPFSVAATDIDEISMMQGPGPAEWKAEHLARAKAEAAGPGPERFVIAADTIVVLDGRVLGKPASPAEAEAMLAALRARDHQVMTGVAVLDRTGGTVRSGVQATTVRMRPYLPDEIGAYVRSGDPLDKAGGYAVQHAGFHPVEQTAGCYWNVVGLPLCLVTRLLTDAGVPALAASARGPGRCTLCAPSGPLPAPASGPNGP